MVNGIPSWFLLGMIYVCLLAGLLTLAVVMVRKEQQEMNDKVWAALAAIREWKEQQERTNVMQDGRLGAVEIKQAEAESNAVALFDNMAEFFDGMLAVFKTTADAAQAKDVAAPLAQGARKREIHKT